MSDRVREALRRYFGFDGFRPNQEEIVQAILGGRDVFAVMPTGGGKSLCYQLPAVLLEGACVVISPLLALMKDQVDSAKELGIRAGAINSTTSKKEYAAVANAFENGRLDLLYISPERFNLTNFGEWLKRGGVSFFAIDEAHCISEWGHQFRSDYLSLKNIVDIFPDVPIAAFTATATDAVARDIRSLLRLRDPFCVRASFDRPNLHYQIVYRDDLREQLTTFLNSVPGEAGIIYRGTRKNVEETAQMLANAGFSVRPYHAGMSDSERMWVQDAFAKDTVQIIVATIAFGMGIDKSNVRFVIHADMPKNLEGYYQETGRAGRDGSPSRCLLLFAHQDMMLYKAFIDDYDDPKTRDIAGRQLSEMMRFAESDQCRRRSLLQYFSETYVHENCGACDYCSGDVQREDATISAQKALSAMVRTGNRFGINHLIDILVGAKTAKLRKFRHDQLPTFGVGKDQPKRYWRILFNALIYSEYAIMDIRSQYPIPQITPRGMAILRGQETFEMIRFPLIRKRITTDGDDQDGTYVSEHNMFELLRACRSRLADERNVPPYVVFTDKTLLEMAHRKPRTFDELLDVPGVSEKKLEKYGHEFLRILLQNAEPPELTDDFDAEWEFQE